MENNITVRKQLKRRNSYTDLSNLHSEDIFLDSILSDGLNLSTNSAPSIPEQYIIQIQELKDQIDALRSENESAHQEIVNLNIECTQLKKELAEKNRQIHLLKTVSGSSLPGTPLATTSTQITITPPLKKLNKLRMQISRISPINRYSGIESQSETPKCRPQQLLNHRTKNLEELTQDEDGIPNQQIISLPHKSQNTQNTHQALQMKNRSIDGSTHIEKRKIFILGDEQAKGLAKQLRQSLNNKNDHTFEVFGMIKPNADSSEILKTCETFKNSLNERDIVILSMGSHDKNPCQLFANLNSSLYLLQPRNVFIVGVQQNLYNINEFFLNSNLKSLGKTHSNFTFIDMNCKNIIKSDIRKFTRMLSLKLHVEIEFLKYPTKHKSKLSPTFLPLRESPVTGSKLNNHENINNQHSTEQCNKNPIPFFRPQT